MIANRHKFGKYIFLFSLYFLLFSPWASAQQWAIKSLPIIAPKAKETHLLLPLAVEFSTSERYAFQVCPMFKYKRETAYGTIRGEQSQYTNLYHLNVGVKRFLGKRKINRAWFLGINTWCSVERVWSKEPLMFEAYPSTIYKYNGNHNWYRGFGGFLGKNFALGERWFVETKVAIEHYNERLIYYGGTTEYGIQQYTTSTEYFMPRFSLLVGYRWKNAKK